IVHSVQRGCVHFPFWRNGGSFLSRESRRAIQFTDDTGRHPRSCCPACRSSQRRKRPPRTRNVSSAPRSCSRRSQAAPAYEERKEWSRFWLVDPLDGTKEFVKRNGEFSVNIALVENGFPILGVVHA